MKKIITFTAMLVFVLCFTGCMRFNTTIEVKNNGKVDVSMLLAAKSEDGSDSSTSDSYDDLKNEGWEVEDYKEDGYVGMICKKKNLNLDNLAEEMGTSEEETMVMDSNDFKITKKGFTYSFDWDYEGQDDTEDSSQYIKSIVDDGGYMTFTLKVPIKAKSSNATTVTDGGRTLEWDLLALKPGEGIHAEFVLINWTLIIAIILVIVGIIVLILVFIALANNKKNSIPSQQPMNQYGGMQQPMNQYGAQQPVEPYGQPVQPQQAPVQQPIQQPYQQPMEQPYQAAPQQPYQQPVQPEQPMQQPGDDTFQPYQ